MGNRENRDGEHLALAKMARDVAAAYETMTDEDMRANARVALRVIGTLIEDGQEVTPSDLALEIGKMVIAELSEELRADATDSNLLN